MCEGKVVKAPLSDQDIQLVIDLFERIRPHQIYAAGDLSDPHGTHRVCLQVGPWIIVRFWEARDVACHADRAQHGAGVCCTPAARPQIVLAGWEIIW